MSKSTLLHNLLILEKDGRISRHVDSSKRPPGVTYSIRHAANDSEDVEPLWAYVTWLNEMTIGLDGRGMQRHTITVLNKGNKPMNGSGSHCILCESDFSWNSICAFSGAEPLVVVQLSDLPTRKKFRILFKRDVLPGQAFEYSYEFEFAGYKGLESFYEFVMDRTVSNYVLDITLPAGSMLTELFAWETFQNERRSIKDRIKVGNLKYLTMLEFVTHYNKPGTRYSVGFKLNPSAAQS